MARAIWSGAVTFGLVNVPVKLYSAVTPKTVRFNQLSAKTGARIQQKRVDGSTGDEVAFEDIVKGYELTPDRYIIIEGDELDNLAPSKTKAMELERFVYAGELDPLLYDASYYLAPDPAAVKPYRLLVDAMRRQDKVGIARFVLRTKEHLVALRPSAAGVLVCTTMVFPDEVNDPFRLDGIGEEGEPGAAPSEREVAMAEQLIASMSEEFDHSEYRDTYREQVLKLIEAKAAGEAFDMPAPVEAPDDGPDLMAALEASLAGIEDKPAKAKQAPAKRKAKQSTST